MIKHLMVYSLLLIAVSALGQEGDLEIKGELEWPKKWTVFAPLHQDDPVLENDVFESVPESIQLPKRGSFPERTITSSEFSVEPGRPFYFPDVFEQTKRGNTAYIFIELDSPKEQVVTLGIGADWWFQAWLNGKPVYDTLENGNMASPFTVLNHTFEVALREGVNVLALRAIGGKNMSLVVGGPDEIRTAEKVANERERAYRFNRFPEKFEDRMLFPVDDQALVMARRGLTLPHTGADLSQGGLAGVHPMPKRQLRFYPLTKNTGEMIDVELRRFPDPVTIRLSKSRYPWEDRHLDAIVWMTPPEEGDPVHGQLDVVLQDGEGATLASHSIKALSPNGMFFSVGFPTILSGGNGILEVTWRDGDQVLGSAEQTFHVDAATDVPRAGRVPLRMLNGPGVTMGGAPMTVGVPFPRGVLNDENQVKLVDEQGQELPLQTKVLAKWSRFGSIKWLLCDFTVDLAGTPRTLFLEYGPEIERTRTAPLAVKEADHGFPELDTGRLRVNTDGLAVTYAGANDVETVLSPAALSGAFVTHEDGRTYSMPTEGKCVIEEIGSEKVVVRRTGWYVDEARNGRFCQFVTRFVFHRRSPIVRIFHTWIYTGDDKKDRIHDMGWRFPTAASARPDGILTAFEDGQWIMEDSLVQFDYDTYLLPETGVEQPGRTPGVLSQSVSGARVMFGVKDFWQNFPSELEMGEDSFAFYNWPKRNPAPDNVEPTKIEDAFRLRFVHEGELLDFQLPKEYVSGAIWEESNGRERHWAKDRPETANAQGIARTEEMFLYFPDRSQDAHTAARVLRGLNDETLRAVVDPKWVCDSGALSVGGDIHHRDVETYPEAEYAIDLVYKAPPRWVERLGFYGMWVHGDYPHWKLKLHERTADVYRTLGKNHHTWPYRWIPFARSGDPELLKLAESATRQMTDAYFCHYATAEVDAAVGPDYYRRQGWWDRSLLPWAGRGGPLSRTYTIESDYLWHAWYMTGYTRARDVALLFGDLTKQDHHTTTGPRPSSSWLSSYLDMYSATFDPWYLAAIHELAELYEQRYDYEEDVDKFSFVIKHDYAGHTWRGEQQKLYQFTGDDMDRRLALNNAIAWGSQRRMGSRLSGADVGAGAPPALSAFTWSLTGDDFYLKRAAAALDMINICVYDGEVDYLRGSWRHLGHAYLPLRNARWDGPAMAMAALDKAGYKPEPAHNPFQIFPLKIEVEDETMYVFRLPPAYVRKTGPEAVTLYIDAHGRGLYNSYPFPYELTNLADGTKLSGTWTPPERIHIPADAPEGTYRVDLRGKVPYGKKGETITKDRRKALEKRVARVFYPLGDPYTPEIMTFERHPEGTPVTAGMQGYWFMVPEGISEFWIAFSGREVDRYSVWNPEGKRVVDVYGSAEEAESGQIKITVPPGQDGKLWRATGGGFLLDPKIPPYFSVTREKWFLPEDSTL